MKQVMKRGVSLILTLLMLLCMFPVSTALAASKECTLVMGRDNAPFRTKAHQEGEVVKRYGEGTSLTYTRLYINDALNLWYGVPLYDSKSGRYIERFIYSGNVKKISIPEDAKVEAQVEMSSNLLLKDNCLAQAQKLLDNGNTGYTKEEMAKELFAHAYAYYVGDAIVESKAKLYLTDAVLCALFPTACVTAVSVTKGILEFAEHARNCGNCVEIGESGGFKGIAREKIYKVIWDMLPD